MFVFKFLILLIINLSICEQGARRLHKHLFNSYDALSRPVENPQQKTNVCVDLYVLQIVKISEKNQLIDINMQLAYSWNDTFLRWNSSNYENISQIFANVV
jgi:hypothetical protein